MTAKAPRSLKSRALQLLAQREQSRVELRRKLLAHARACEANEASSTRPTGENGGTGRTGEIGETGRTCGTVTRSDDATDALASMEPAPSTASAERRVDEVIAWLDAHSFLSDDRFTESRITARAGRYGDLRIRQELKQHGLALPADAAKALRDSEASRAWAVWERRFGTAPITAPERARHARFLIARGFSAETVSHVLKRTGAFVKGRTTTAPDDDDD